MELSFSNETCTIKVTFYKNMIKLKERMILDKLPKDIQKHSCKVRKLKDGKIACFFEFFIPNGFVHDALCIDDDKVKKDLREWLKNVFDDIKKQRVADECKKGD